MSNRAAYLMAAHEPTLTIKDNVPIPTPEPHEVVIRNHAVAVNPIDWKVQDWGALVSDYPFILGTDTAGIVHSIGTAVTRFRPGDRVLAHMDGLGNKKIDNNGFQLFSKTNEALVAKLPENLSYAQGTVLPVALSTAAACLFQKEHLGLPFPKSGPRPQFTGGVVLIWGGSSSVGSSAIQLARAAGIEVATTASSRNHEYVKSLGATYVFDHSSTGVVDDIVTTLQGKKFVGVLDTITTEETVVKSGEVASKLDGRKFVATMMPPPAPLPEGVAFNSVYALSVAGNEVGKVVWGQYVPQALANGTLKAKPDPLVVGKGLEYVQEGINKQKAGVSAQKVVIELD